MDDDDNMIPLNNHNLSLTTLKSYKNILILTSSSCNFAKGHIDKANGMWLLFIISAVQGILYIVDLMNAGLQFPAKQKSTS